jgi:hypothetical protein
MIAPARIYILSNKKMLLVIIGSIINVGVTKEENKKKRKNKRAYPKTKPVINPYHTRRYWICSLIII